MIIRTLTSTIMKNINKTTNFNVFSTYQHILPEIKPVNYQISDFILPQIEKEDFKPELVLFNEPEEGKIYEMAFKKTELAKRKRRRRKNGSKTNARWR